MNRREASRILGVDSDAPLEDIKKAYKKKSFKYHPDKNVSRPKKEQQEAEKKFKEISEAYQVLTKPQNNHEFHNDFEQDPFELFNQIFNSPSGPFESMFAGNSFSSGFSSSHSVSTSTTFINGKRVTRTVEKVNGKVVRDSVQEEGGRGRIR